MTDVPETPEVVPSARINEQLVLADVAQRMFQRAQTHKVQIGRYFVLDAIGTGGMGTVYRAYDPKLKRKVALKVLRADVVNGETARRRLRREAVALARLSHPNVVPVHEVGEHGQEVFVAMEYVDGADLAGWAAAHPIDEPGRRDAALRMILAAGRGLSAAHRAGLVHRDVKPANILVGVDRRVLMADFGLVRQLDEATEREAGSGTEPGPQPRSLTVTGVRGGTPRYAAPEQSAGEAADEQSDQFSFCVTAWEVLFGAPPWPGLPVPEAPPSVPPGGDAWLARALLTGLRGPPRARYASMRALLDALEGASGRRRVRAGAIGIAVFACGAAVVYAQTRPSCDPGDAPLQRVSVSPPALASAADAYASQWRAASTQICEAGQVGAARGCLEILGSRVRGVLSVPDAAASLLQVLPEPSGCSQAHPTLALGRSPAANETALAGFEAVAAAEAWRSVGEDARARVIIDALPEAKAERHPALTSALIAFAVRSASLDGDSERAVALARGGYTQAQRHSNPRAAIEFAALLAELADESDEPLAAALWRRHIALLHGDG